MKSSWLRAERVKIPQAAGAEEAVPVPFAQRDSVLPSIDSAWYNLLNLNSFHLDRDFNVKLIKTFTKKDCEVRFVDACAGELCFYSSCAKSSCEIK